MSLHIGLLMIEGNHLPHLGEMLEGFSYHDTGNDREVVQWDEATNYLSNWMLTRSRVLKVACFHQGWTVIFDPEMVMASDADACQALSTTAQACVFGMICEGTSNTYAFNLFDGKKVRGYFSVDGEVFEDFGSPLPEESGLNSDRAYFEDDILAIMQRIGVNYDEIINESTHFVVKELDEGDESPTELPPQGVDTEDQIKPKKLWWQFWK
jgi:hypothetical protein